MDSVNTSAQNFAYVTKNPMVFVAPGSYNWSTQDGDISYMWHDKNVVAGTDNKSIFDPSPIGWRVPIYGVWSDVPTTTTISDKVATYTAGSLTANYYANGYRNRASSTLTGTTTILCMWTSTPGNSTSSHRMEISTTSTNIIGTYIRARGMNIRSIRE